LLTFYTTLVSQQVEKPVVAKDPKAAKNYGLPTFFLKIIFSSIPRHANNFYPMIT